MPSRSSREELAASDASPVASAKSRAFSRGNSERKSSASRAFVASLASMNTSTPLLRMARLTSPRRGSSARNSRNSGCARTTRGSPSAPCPHSETRSEPPVSRSGFSRSSTVGEHRLAFSRSTHSPFVAAWSRTPSTHSNRPALGAAPPHASGPNSASRSRIDSTTESTPSGDPAASPVSALSFVNSSTSMASPPSRVAARVAARASARASTAARSASAAAAASSAAAPRASAASTTDLYADQRDQARSRTSSRVFCAFGSEYPSSAVAAATRNVSVTDASSAARSRDGSFCSNEPSSSEVSVAAVSATRRSVRPARSAKTCATLVLPLAGGPTRMVIHPRDAQCAAASSAPVWPRSTAGFKYARRDGDVFKNVFAFSSKEFSSFEKEEPSPRRRVAKTAPPTRSTPSSTVTAMGPSFSTDKTSSTFSSMTPANASRNRRADSRRSDARRRRREKIVSRVARRASATIRRFFVSSSDSGSVTVFSDLSLRPRSRDFRDTRSPASSHQRRTSRRLNSQGAPALAKLPPGAFAASASEATYATARSAADAGIAGNSAVVMCAMSVFSMGSTCTRVNRFRNDLGRPLRPPPSCVGFCAAKTRNVGGHRNVSPSSGTKTSARWSSAALRPSSTG